MYSFTVLLEVWIKILAEMISAESSQLIDDGLRLYTFFYLTISVSSCKNTDHIESRPMLVT